MSQERISQAQRSQEKKQQIFDVAIALFQEKGYNQTTVRDICSAAGITTGTFYNFYGDKFGLLKEFSRRILAEHDLLVHVTEAQVAAPFQTICDFFLAVSDMQDQFGKEMAREYANRAKDLLSLDSKENGVHLIARLLHRSAEAGYIGKDLNPLDTAEYLVACVMGTFSFWRDLSYGETMRNVARRMFPVFFSAVTDERIVIE